MEPKNYIVSKIEGEYAFLHDLSEACEEDLFIALALLPPCIDVGTKLRCEAFSYEVIE